MSWMDAIRALYEAYIAQVERLERDRKPGDGLLGLGSAPKDDPCHDRFATELEALLKEMRAQWPAPDVVRDVLTYVYRAPSEHREPQSLYWMLRAVHGLTVELVPLLLPTDAKELRDAYAKEYRRWDRFPAQKRVLAALEKAGRA